MKPNRLVTATISLALLILLTNCNVSPNAGNNSNNQIANAPLAAVEAAINDIRTQDKKINCPTGLEEMKDFRTVYAEVNKVTPADAANGLEERWTIIVGYIYKCNGEVKWRDASSFNDLEKRKDGIWQVRKLRAD